MIPAINIVLSLGSCFLLSLNGKAENPACYCETTTDCPEDFPTEENFYLTELRQIESNINPFISAHAELIQFLKSTEPLFICHYICIIFVSCCIVCNEIHTPNQDELADREGKMRQLWLKCVRIRRQENTYDEREGEKIIRYALILQWL